MPEAEQGTSARMRSNGTPSHHSSSRVQSAAATPSRRVPGAQGCLRSRAARFSSDVKGGQLRRRRVRGCALPSPPAPRKHPERAARSQSRGSAQRAARRRPARRRRRQRSPEVAQPAPVLEQQAVLADATRAMPRFAQAAPRNRFMSARRRFTRKRHRRMRIARRQHRLPFGRVCAAQQVDPPERMLIASFRIVVEPASIAAALAQERAKQGIDITLCRPSLEQATGSHRLIDHGVFARIGPIRAHRAHTRAALPQRGLRAPPARKRPTIACTRP